MRFGAVIPHFLILVPLILLTTCSEGIKPDTEVPSIRICGSSTMGPRLLPRLVG